jgi:serine/threonine protein kinase
VPRPRSNSRAADVDRVGTFDDVVAGVDVSGVGARVGPYRVLRHLGQGGMGTLALGVRDGDVDPVVLKRPLADGLSAHALALARREAVIASSLDHPGVVRVVDVVNDDGVPVLVMEHLLGLTLHEVGKRARHARLSLPMEPLLDVIAQAARALHYVHTLRDDDGRPRGLVHRDIAPDNLFLTGDGTVKLLDFGVARGDDVEELTQFGSLKGKRGYFAPELITGHPPDARTDLFALGVTLYWLLCGRLPWGARDPGPAYVAMMSAPPPPPSSRNPFVPAAVDELVQGLIAVERDERFADGAAVAARVEEMLRRVDAADRDAIRLVDLVGGLPDAAPSSSSSGAQSGPPSGPPAAAPAALLAAASAVVAATATRATRAGDDDEEKEEDGEDDEQAPGDDALGPTIGSRPMQRWDARGASGVEDDESRTHLARRGLRASPTLHVVGVTRARATNETVTLAGAALVRARGGPDVDARLASSPGSSADPSTSSARGGQRRAPRAALVGAALGALIVVVIGCLVWARTAVVADVPSPSRAAPAEPPSAPASTIAATAGATAATTTTMTPAATPPLVQVAETPPQASEPAASMSTPSSTATPSSPSSPSSPSPSSPSSPSSSRDDDPSPSSRPRRASTMEEATRSVALRGPARIAWSAGGRALRNGPGDVVIPAGTKRVTGFDPRRGVQSEVVVSGGVADWDALPRVSLLLRARPWANVRLGDENLGQTPLQPVRVVPGRYRVRFEQDDKVVVRVVDVRADAAEVKVNVDMADAR